MKNALEQLEADLAEYIGTKYSIVTSSGRMSLEIALKALDIKGSVIIPNLACPVVPAMILKAGALPMIGEMKEDTSLNLESVTGFEKHPDRPSALMPIYFYGCPTDDPNEVLDFSRKLNTFIIEDVAQAFGARRRLRRMGSLGDMGIFSFPKVFFDLFRGGAITTNDNKTAEKAKRLRNELQMECSASTLSMISRRYQLKGRIKGKFERITRSVLNTRENRIEPAWEGLMNTLKPPYQIYDAPYFYEHLTELEIERALQTLGKIDDLKRKRQILVERIMKSARKHEGFELLHDFNEDFVYTRVPVLLDRRHLAHWISFLQGRGVGIDMVYAPISMSSVFKEKCKLLGDYATSVRLSHQVLPLPVTEKVVEQLG